MNYVILDLEWNGTYSRRMKGYINEIIEFGAVKVDDNLAVIDTFDEFVRPQVGKQISSKIESLTSITNEDLEDGLHFMQAISRFKKWMGEAVLMTWGTSDILTLIENCRYFCGNEKIPFLKEYIDLQRYCESCLQYETGKQMGLSTCAQLLNIDEEGMDHHRALDDSILSLECLVKLYQKERLLVFLQDAEDSSFYDRMKFKTVVICDLNNPLIKRSYLVFYCDKCGKCAQRQGEWILKNKSYRAQFFCKSCNCHFWGKIQFKLKYEGLVIKKTTIPSMEKREIDDQ